MPASQIKFGVILSYISQGAQILVTLLYTPVLLKLLGQSQYGIYQITASVVAFLSVMTFGFSGSYLRFYAEIKHKEPEKLSQLNGSYLLIFFILGLIVLILGFILSANTGVVLGGKLTDSELVTAEHLMYILVLNCFFQFILIVFNNNIIAHERFIPMQLIVLMGTLLNPCLTFPLLLSGTGAIGMGIALFTITLIQLLIEVYYCLRKLKVRFSFRNLELGLIKDIGSFSFFIFIETIVSLINVSLDRFLIGKLIGAVATAIYAVGGQINTLYTTVSQSLSSVFAPRINKLVQQGNKDSEINGIFIKVGSLQYVILGLILTGFFTFGKRFMILWAGPDYVESYYIAMVLIIPNTINLIQNIAYEVQRAKNLQKYRSYIWIIIAALNAIISIFLIKEFGPIGAAIGTATAWVIGSGFIMNIFYKKKAGLDVLSFWKKILRISIGLIVPVILGVILKEYTLTCPVRHYILLILAYIVIYMISMFFLGSNRNERKYVLGYMHRFTKGRPS